MRAIQTALIAIVAARWYGTHLMAASETSQTDEVQIKQVQEEMVKASIAGDAASFVKHLADGYTSTQADGTVLTRDQVRQRRTSGQLRISSIQVTDLHIVVHGDSAIASFKSTIKSQFKGRDTSGVFQTTRSWIKQAGEWKVAADHTSRLRARRAQN